MNGFNSGMGSTPPVLKNIIIINVLLFLATLVLEKYGVNLNQYLALYYPGSEYFRPHQLITHMFMHGGWSHLFFNMFGLWMFGRILEQVWGSRRFMIYYFATGLGAAALHLLVNHLLIMDVMGEYKAMMKQRLSIPLMGQDPLLVRKYLLKYLPEDLERNNPPLSEQITRLLKL